MILHRENSRDYKRILKNLEQIKNLKFFCVSFPLFGVHSLDFGVQFTHTKNSN